MAPAFHPVAARSIQLLRAITVDLGEPDYVDELQAFDLLKTVVIEYLAIIGCPDLPTDGPDPEETNCVEMMTWAMGQKL